MASTKTLYRINDKITELANELDLLYSSGADGDGDTLDDIIDEATHAVAAIFWPDED